MNGKEDWDYFEHFSPPANLSPEDEEAACREIASLERKLWETVFELPTTLPMLRDKLGASWSVLEEVTGRSLADKVAGVMEVDDDRHLIRDVLTVIAKTPTDHSWKSRIDQISKQITRKKNAFITSNMRLVCTLARKFGRQVGLTQGDLIQEGSMGLMKALNRYEVERGLRFSTFASWWIRAVIGRAIADRNRLVRVPVHVQDAASQATRRLNAHAAKTGQQLTPEELAECSKLSPAKAREIMVHMHYQKLPMLTFDAAVATSDARLLSEIIPSDDLSPEEVLCQKQERSMFDCLDILTPIESRVVRWKCGLNSDEMRIKEIGNRLNLSRERVRQVYEGAVRKLRREIRVNVQTGEYSRREAEIEDLEEGGGCQ